ncbi:FeoA family protein [Fusibacter sp. 3D3]|uniref:FeoA family protein n=1 Tax=Fusibacter sp. 3D3 TaxID=1048380 RepID=UPI00085360E5|nr:FeoA family protein [Fusibacter sp. 3D3]GAU75476.1 hypothetical protein F3D3_0067 [Fusibacter sp. 3D3]
MALTNAVIGKHVVLNTINGSDKLKRKLRDMGLTDGVRFMPVLKTRNGPMVVEIRGTRLAISDQIAAMLDVTPASV